eukprot:gene417-674_t
MQSAAMGNCSAAEVQQLMKDHKMLFSSGAGSSSQGEAAGLVSSMAGQFGSVVDEAVLKRAPNDR